MNNLSPRMHDVLHLLANGHTYKEAAFILSIKRETVRVYAYRAMARLNARTVTQAVVIYAIHTHVM